MIIDAPLPLPRFPPYQIGDNIDTVLLYSRQHENEQKRCPVHCVIVGKASTLTVPQS